MGVIKIADKFGEIFIFSEIYLIESKLNCHEITPSIMYFIKVFIFELFDLNILSLDK